MGLSHLEAERRHFRARPPLHPRIMTATDHARATRSAAEPSEGTQSWIEALEQLHAALTPGTEPPSAWTTEWSIHRWANEALSESTAIRIGESEGLSGPAPAKWRILAHIDGKGSACSLAILPGRASRSADNVLAASLRDHCGRTVIAARGHGLYWLLGDAPEESDEGPSTLETLIDALSSGQLEELPTLPLDLDLAFSLMRDEAQTPRAVERSA